MRNLLALNNIRNIYVFSFFVNQMFSKALRVLLNNQYLSLRITKMLWALRSLDQLQKYSVTRIRDRCFITGSAKSYVRLTGLSRHFTRKFIHEGSLPSFASASW